MTLPNSKGCGQVGTGIQIMRRCLVNLTQNPNVAATLLVGLGCETTRPYELLESIKQLSEKPVEILTIQECGGSVNAIACGTEIARGLVVRAAHAERPALDLSQIVLGTNCGGSDATSGLAANPVIGVVSDAIVESGGTVMLGETTELIGTEDILAARASTDSVARDILGIVHGLEAEFDGAHVDVRGANPSPGNMRGGLSTLEEKALGGIVKGGTSPITEVIGYGEIPSQKGLVIMDTPG
ncbi:MAG: UxaA family hydrolase, partial [Olsenella sp.]